MHILILPTWYVSPERPDLGIYFREQALALEKAGQETGVVYVDVGLGNTWKKLKKLRRFDRSFTMDQGLSTLRLEGLGFPKRLAWTQWLYARLVLQCYEEYCQQVGIPDLIHAQGYTAGFAASRIKQRWDIPFVYSEHLSTLKNHRYPVAHGRMLEAALRQADAITAVSFALAGWMQEKTARPIRVIPNLVNTGFFRPDPSQKTGTFTFLYVGDLIPIKAVDVLLRAFAGFLRTNADKNVRLDLVGTGHLQNALEKLAHSLAIASRVRFHGLLPAAAVLARMQAADCLVLSSQTETFGVVQTEAMACGLPVIATDCGGPADIVTPETGLLVPVDDAPALAQAMTTLFGQYDRYDPHQIRASAVQRFGAENVTKKWISLYGEVIEAHRK